MVDAGSITVTAFISPYKQDRDNVRAILEDGEFIEVYTKCSVEECEKRDLKDCIRKHALEKFLSLQVLALLMKLQIIQKSF